MDNLTSYRLTLLFIFAIVVPSTVVAFIASETVTHHRAHDEAILRNRFQEKGRELVEAFHRRLEEPAEALSRALETLAQRAERLPDLAEPVRALAGERRPFRAAVLVGPQGTLVSEAPPEGGALLASAGPVVARGIPLDEVFRPVEDLERIGEDPEAALARLEEVERAFREEEPVRAEALAIRARLFGRLESQFQDNAYEALRELIERYPLARDRDGGVLSLGARLELAAIWRRWGQDEKAARELRELARFTARHEDALRPTEAQYYRERALAGLREIDPELARQAGALLETARRDREAARAFAASLRGARLRERLEGLAARGERSGYLKLEPGRPPIFHHVLGERRPPGGGAAGDGSPARPPLGTALFELDLEGLRARDLEPRLEDAHLHDEGFFRLEPRAPATPSSTAGAEREELCRLPLRPPLDDLELVARIREPAETWLADRIRSWAIGLALLGLGAGAFVMTRAVRKEMRVSELKSDFVTTVTHELKTPLTSIGMFAETLLMGRVEDEEEKRECLEIIAKETDRLTRLIDRVLTFSKIEAGKKRFDLRLADLGLLVEETVELFRTQMRGAPRPFTLRTARIHELPAVLLDRGSIQEVLLNLLSNAYKYGGPELGRPADAARPEGLTRRIEVMVSKRRRWAFVEVRDWGIGIPRREQRKIFHKFYRTNDMLTRDVEGTGIGLTLAQSIAHAHRGDITVRSKVGHGSTFTLWLRL